MCFFPECKKQADILPSSKDSVKYNKYIENIPNQPDQWFLRLQKHGICCIKIA